MSDTQEHELPTSLPSAEEALLGLRGLKQEVVPTSPVEVPLTVRLIREARLQAEIKRAERKKLGDAKRAKSRKKRHYMQKRAVKRKSNEKYHRDHYRTSLEHRFSRWKRRGRTKAEGIEMDLEEFGLFWKRIDPKHQLPFYRVPERVRWDRLDTSLPWRLDNLMSHATIGKGRKKRTLKWKTLLLEEATSEQIARSNHGGD